MENKKVFEVTVDDKVLKLAVLRPTNRVQEKARQAYNKAFAEAVTSKAIVRARIDKLMREQNLWDDESQELYDKLTRALLDGERKLTAAGLKMGELKAIALQMRKDRDRLRDLTMYRNQLDMHTAEAQAENARFNYMVYACTVHADTGKAYFASYDEYLDKPDDPVSNEASTLLGRMIYGLEDNWEAKLPENKFLLKWKLVDDKLRLINKDGHLIDEDGRLIDEKGRFVSPEGEFVDREGNPVTEEGEYKLDYKGIYDDVTGELIPEPVG